MKATVYKVLRCDLCVPFSVFFVVKYNTALTGEVNVL